MISTVNIKFFREREGMTQAELAERVFVDQSAVSNWEQGKYPPRRRLLPLIAKALNCTVEELTEERQVGA